MSEWTSLDKASHRSLVIAAYRASRITGAKAFDEFSHRNLWEDKEEAFFHYVNGLTTFEVTRELWGAPEYVRRGAKRIVLFLYGREVIRIDTAQWLINLFGVNVE